MLNIKSKILANQFKKPAGVLGNYMANFMAKKQNAANRQDKSAELIITADLFKYHINTYFFSFSFFSLPVFSGIGSLFPGFFSSTSF